MTFSLAKDIYYATHAHPNDLLDETPVVSRERGDYKIRRIHRMSGNEAESIDELYDAVDNENFKRVAEIIESGVKLDDVRIEVEWIAEWFATYLYSFRNAHLRNPEEEEKYEDAKRVLMLLFLSGAPFEPTYLQYLVEEPVLFEAALHAGITFETNAEGGHRLLFKIKNPDVLQIAIENGINLTTKQNGMTFCHFLANEMIKEPIEPYVIPISIVFLQALSKSNKIGTIPLLELRLYLFGTMIHDRQKDLDTMMKSVGFDLHDAYHEDEPMDANALISARNLTDIFCVLFMEHNAITANIPRVIFRTTFFGYQTNHPDKMTDEKIEFWRNKMLTYFPHGEDMVGNDGPLFYLHQHTASQGLTAETIEYQLEKAGKEDQEKIPCFFHIIGNHSSCQEPIQRVMISAIVSNEAWDAWDANGEAARKKKEQEKRNARKMRTGLNEQMPAYTTILRNRKKKQEDNTIAHSWTMCAFCLLPMERTYGCNYMGHEKPSMAVEHRLHPWCPARFFVKDLWEKYVQVGRRAAVQQLDRPADPQLDHIETCIECGRPCCNHHHVDLEHPGKVIMLANDPQYKQCPGGGRRELIARILAVRQVYRKGGFKTPLEERRAAAWAADAAATNPEMLAKADELLANESVNANQNYTRNFGNNLPINKTYENDPAYQLYESVKPLANSANASNGKQAAANQRIVREDHERVHELAHRDDVAAQAAPMPNRQNRQRGGTKRKKRVNRRTRKMKR